MSALDLNKIRDKLEEDRIKLVSDIQTEREKLNTQKEVNPDPLDLAYKSYQQEIISGRLRHVKRKLKQVEAALKRIEENTYGICVKCGNPINPERLAAIPYAALCVNCQKRQEH